MDKLLPVIEVEKPEPEPESVAVSLADNVLPESGVRIPERNDKGNMDLIDTLHAEAEQENDDIISVEERDIPEEDDVFGSAPAPRVKPLEVEEEPSQSTEFNPAQGTYGEPKKGKRKYTRKAPMSDKQKEHLAKIRKIAIEKRKAEKERKIKEKEEAVIAKAEKKILEKKLKEEKAQGARQAEQEVINSQLSKATDVKEPVIQQNGFTKQDLDSAVLSAISQYDTLRKQQKKEKREAQIKEMKEAKMRETLARAIQPQQPTNDPWRNLFT